jgi:MFS family permease
MFSLIESHRDFPSGTICISMTLITSAAGPFLFEYLPNSIKKISLVRRSMVLCVCNAVFTALMGSLDYVLERYPSGELALVIIFILRSLQGFTVGILFVIVQVSAKHSRERK